jgi:predicted dehydrogenase
MPWRTSLRVAVTGTGFGARVHVPSFQSQPGVEVVAISSARLERARAAAEQHGVPQFFDDHLRMLREIRPDVVSIATPPRLHRDMVIQALEQGVHVLCEKPLALNLTEAGQMLQTARFTSGVHAVGHELRFLPQYQEITRLLADQAIGTVVAGSVQVFQWPRANAPDPALSWLSRREEGGGVLGLWGTHYADLLTMWLGPIDQVVCTAGTALPRRRLPWLPKRLTITSEDTVAAVVRFESGASVCMQLSNAALQGRGPRIELHGTRGSLVCEEGRLYMRAGRGLLTRSELRVVGPDPQPSIDGSSATGASEHVTVKPYGNDSLDAYRALVREFVVGIRGGDHRCPSLRDGYRSLAFAEACRESSATGRWTHPRNP